MSRIDNNGIGACCRKSMHARSNVSAVTPTPAATLKRPFESLQAMGLSFALVISL